MRLIYWCSSRIFLNLLYQDSRTFYRWRGSFIKITPDFARRFNVSSLLLKKDFDRFHASKTNVQSIKRENSDRVTNEDDSERELLADKNSPQLNEPKSSKTKPNEFEARNKFSQKKKKADTIKKFMIRSVITSDQLKIKVKNILKYVEKGQKVTIIITGNNPDGLNKVIKELKESELNNFIIATDKSLTSANLTYGIKNSDTVNS